jgi:hypothetical protein
LIIYNSFKDEGTANRKEKQEAGTAEGKPITNYQLPIIQTKEILIGIHCCTIRNI